MEVTSEWQMFMRSSTRVDALNFWIMTVPMSSFSRQPSAMQMLLRYQ